MRRQDLRQRLRQAGERRVEAARWPLPLTGARATLTSDVRRRGRAAGETALSCRRAGVRRRNHIPAREATSMLSRRRLLWSAASALAPFVSSIACAQEWRTRVVRLIVPYPAGGGADAIARIVSGRLSEMWGQQVVIENRGGAGGNIASEAAARSAPDGYTLYLAGEFQATNVYLYPKLNYDPVADFEPVSLVVQYPIAMVVPNSSPARSVKELIVHAKANPGKLTMASPGHGTGPHLAGEMFKRAAGI